uniref:MORC family CW-type zinc finger 1 n=1 Tax=Ailuropoda melanoleuca TaxID=9646 RepID=A0A7N5KQZ0_AILME
MAGAFEDFPERWSFRAYTSVLYFEPWMRIFIQAKRVKTKHLCYCLYSPRKYLYVTSSFKGAFKNEVKKAEEAVKIAELVLKEAQITVNQPDRTSLSSAKDVLQKAFEDVEAKRKILKEKQRELKKARTLCLFFGVNIENRSQAGMFIYSNNRLIKMHQKVGPQLKLKSLLGAGVVGIVNIPLEIMEPSHNKQEFLNVQEYNHLLRVMGQYLVQYCKDTGISNRNLTLFWNEFGYQSDKDMEKSLDSVQYQRRQAMAIPFIIQCDLCLKWRVLPPSITYQEKEFFDFWVCANNPNLLENSCHQAERLPSIPLGTMSSMSPSKTEKEKQLREAVQRYHSQLADRQPQPQFIPTSRITEFTTPCQTSASKKNTKTQKVRLWGDNLKQESLASFEPSVSHRGWKRNTEGTDPDVEYIAEAKIMTKSPQKKAKPQQHRRPAALRANVSRAQESQASSLEMNRKQSQNLVQECKALTEVETSNDYCPDIILVLDKSDTEVSLKQEKKEVSLMKKEKQEPCSDTPEIKRNSSLPNQEREILLYFLPEYQLSSDFGYTSVEELAVSFELEQCPEQRNKKLRMFLNQIQNVYMAQYERELKRKMQSIIYDANRRGVVNEISLGQCEKKRKMTEDKLNNLRVKLRALLQKLKLGSPAGDLEQIDRYLEALLKEDNPFFRNALNKVATDAGRRLPLEKNRK